MAIPGNLFAETGVMGKTVMCTIGMLAMQMGLTTNCFSF